MSGSKQYLQTRATLLPYSYPKQNVLVISLAIALSAGAFVNADTHAQTSQAAASASTSIAHVIDLPAGPLAQSLNMLAQQTGTQIIFAGGLTDGKQTDALRGSYSAAQALQYLLQGSGLKAIVRDGKTFTVSKEADAGVEGGTLPAVTVSTGVSATSEGTGSYAARAASIMKGAQSLREIPLSISVIGRQQIDDQGLTTVDDAMAQVAGISLTGSSDGESEYWARGYRMSAQVNGVQSTTGIGRFAFSLPALAMYDRIEVLRGVGGLLRGNGEPGGVVNYVKKRPGSAPATSVSMRAGSWEHYSAELDVSRPLNDDGSLRGRAVLAYQDENKFYDVATDQAKLAYGVLEYDLTSATTLGLSASYSHRKQTPFWGLPHYSDASGLPGRSSFIGDDDKMHTRQTDLDIDMEHRFDSGWKLKAAYSHVKLDREYRVPYSTSTIDATTGLGTVMVGHELWEQTNKAFDLNVSGPVQLFGRTHNLTVGYDRQETDQTNGATWTSAGAWDVLNDHDFSAVVSATPPSMSQSRTSRSGFYTNGRINLADDWTVVLGGRWSDYSTKRRGVTVPSDWSVSNARANNKFTPFGGVLWNVSEQVTLYGSYSEIFEPQSETDYTGRVLEPRIGWQSELGAKGEFFDGRLNASIALFRMRDENRVINDPDPTHVGCGSSGTGICPKAAGLWQSQGWEMEVSGSLRPGWDVSASYTRTMTKVLRADDPSTEGHAANVRVPEHLLKIWTQYRPGASVFNGTLEGWSFGTGVYASSRIGGTTIDAPRQGGYATVSAKAGYRINKTWDASLLIGNLFDRSYMESVGWIAGYNHYGKPRNFTLTLNGHF